MKTKTLLAAALTAALGYSMNAQATIIDLFDDPGSDETPNYQLVQDFVNGVSPVADQFPGGGDTASATIIGGFRDLIVDAISGASLPVTGSTLLVQDGSLQFSNTTSSTTGVNGVGIVQWDGDDDGDDVGDLDATGLGGLNLINQEGCPVDGCDRFEATVLFADAGFEYNIGVYTDEDNYTILTADTQFAVNTPYIADYLFDWFQLPTGDDYFLGGLLFDIEQFGSGVDLTNVGAIQLTLNTNSTLAVDLTIDSITKTVPEPGMLALMGVGLLAGGLAGRRRQAHKA